ncbi:MAG: glycerophosphodiester phosphodiesterase [Chloroflexota bacterium]|nr:glycerophosphodiester phosphodiesterase [Chloroflexota bacterium]
MRKKVSAAVLGLGLAGVGAYAALKRRSKPVPDHPFLDLPKPLVMAHRGGMGLWPPNTLYAYERSVQMGVDVLEMDIHMSADGTIIVRHDPTVDATTNGSGTINDLTLAEIKSLDAGYIWTGDNGQSHPFRGLGITIPTLEEVLDAFPGIRLNIDIKPEEPEIVPVFAQVLRDYERLDSVLVASFHDAQLERFRRLCPQTATAAGVSETRSLYILNRLCLGDIYQPKAEAFQPPEISNGRRVVTERFVREAHAHNMEVHVWTVNELEDMQRLLDWGVDGLITDYPDRLLSLLGRY